MTYHCAFTLMIVLICDIIATSHGMVKDINEGSIPDVWYSVTRFSTREWGKQLYPPGSYLHQEFTDIGFYEGLSTGMPGAENTNGSYFKKSLAPYGCWFHFLVGSSIYIKLNRIIPKNSVDAVWNELTGASGCLQKIPGLFCGDKYKCTKVLNNNYDSFFAVHNIENIEATYCNDQCATVGYNISCPPIELRTGYRAGTICNCSSDNENLNCDNNKQVHSGHQASAMHLIQHQLSRESIHSFKCVINSMSELTRHASKYFQKKFEDNFEITIYFSSQLIANQYSIQNKIFNYNMLDYEKNLLLINMEYSSLHYFGYSQNYNYSADNSYNNDHSSYLNEYSNEVQREKERIINFNLGSKRGQWDEPRYRYASIHYKSTLYQNNAFYDEVDTLPVYMNVIGFDNPTILHIGKVAVGLICYDLILLERRILDYEDLIYWLIKEIKCLQSKRVDLIGVIGQGTVVVDDNSVHHKIFDRIKDYIHFNLIVNSDINSMNHNIIRSVNNPILSFISNANVQVLEIKKKQEDYIFKSMLL